jgi:UDP-N-acetylglucosamine--N-acetylmuramyl-(pentapeptide) pyrophosphoryl-undecaprenol N-acetylglucosamine transferase
VTEIAYVGTSHGLENRVIPQQPWIQFFKIRMRGFERRSLWRCLVAAGALPIGLWQSLRILIKFRPDLIIGVGGYASFPPLLWGILLKIPTLIHEQNLRPGLANRVLARWVSKVCLSYSQTARYLWAKSVVVTGLPVRPSLLEAKPRPEQFGLTPHRKTVCVVGGSRGSDFLTQTVLRAQPQLPEAQFLVVTGTRVGEPFGDLNSTSKTDRELTHPFKLPTHARCGRRGRLVQVPYVEDMGAALAVADLVVCRAGASTLAELTALGKPAILVPWPGAAENHQVENARAAARSGGFLVAIESELDADKLGTLIHQLLHDESALSQMKSRIPSQGRRTALDQILREVEGLVQ